MSHNYRILVALRLAHASNRAFLRGIARFRKRNPHWRVTIADGFTDFMQSDREYLKNFDGLITAQPQTDMAKSILARTKIPIAVLGHETSTDFLRAENAIFVRGAAEEVGVIAARHFQSLGDFNSYAFISAHVDGTWSDARAKGFCDELRRRGIAPKIIDTGFPDGSDEDAQTLVHRLSELDLPAAILCAYDNRALQVLLACETAGVNVPKEASVIGVDNDTTLCDFSNPSITSIAINQVEMGEVAANGLEKLLKSKARSVRSVITTVPDAHVIERESTAPVVPAKHLVDRARRFIAEHYGDRIKVKDVIAYLGVSRALADRRFKSFSRTTLNEEINRVKIAAVKRMLSETNLSIMLITERCGFAAPQYAKRLFKSMTGKTMREWRNEVTARSKEKPPKRPR